MYPDRSASPPYAPLPTTAFRGTNLLSEDEAYRKMTLDRPAVHTQAAWQAWESSPGRERHKLAIAQDAF
jgi:hypothetical protein